MRLTVLGECRVGATGRKTDNRDAVDRQHAISDRHALHGRTIERGQELGSPLHQFPPMVLARVRDGRPAEVRAGHHASVPVLFHVRSGCQREANEHLGPWRRVCQHAGRVLERDLDACDGRERRRVDSAGQHHRGDINPAIGRLHGPHPASGEVQACHTARALQARPEVLSLLQDRAHGQQGIHGAFELAVTRRTQRARPHVR